MHQLQDTENILVIVAWLFLEVQIAKKNKAKPQAAKLLVSYHYYYMWTISKPNGSLFLSEAKNIELQQYAAILQYAKILYGSAY